jgi:hypothetical protein
MGIYDAQQVVPKLDASDSSFWKWDAAVKLYAQIHDATDILIGVKTRPTYPSYEGLIATLAGTIFPEHTKRCSHTLPPFQMTSGVLS